MPKRDWDEFDEAAANEGAAISESRAFRVDKPAGKRIRKQRNMNDRGNAIQQQRIENRYMVKAVA